jgi:hypothetical protein
MRFITYCFLIEFALLDLEISKNHTSKAPDMKIPRICAKAEAGTFESMGKVRLPGGIMPGITLFPVTDFRTPCSSARSHCVEKTGNPSPCAGSPMLATPCRQQNSPKWQRPRGTAGNIEAAYKAIPKSGSRTSATVPALPYFCLNNPR